MDVPDDAQYDFIRLILYLIQQQHFSAAGAYILSVCSCGTERFTFSFEVASIVIYRTWAEFFPPFPQTL